MNLRDIISEETFSNSSSHSFQHYESRLNVYIICGKCERCNFYVYTKSHQCEEKYSINTDKFLTHNYNPNRINNIDLYIYKIILCKQS